MTILIDSHPNLTDKTPRIPGAEDTSDGIINTVGDENYIKGTFFDGALDRASVILQDRARSEGYQSLPDFQRDNAEVYNKALTDALGKAVTNSQISIPADLDIKK